MASARTAVLAALVCSGCGVADSSWGPAETVVENRKLDPGGTVSIENQNGSVRVEGWDQGSVRIEAEKRARGGASLEAIRVEISGEGDRLDVMTRLPRRWPFGQSGSVRYTVMVPRGAHLKVTTANGGVEVQGMAGPVRASTVNGSVTVLDASGRVEASTVNGGIRASFRATGDDSHSFSTTNGSVAVTLPQGVSGAFEARTTNGSIKTDFPLTVRGGAGGKRLEGRLGEGNARFEMRTVNGSVRIEKEPGSQS